MAATEKRNGVSRRGMTVLGKVPIAPKPLNLPSQRSTFCWGSVGRLPNGGGLCGKFESALIDPVSNGDELQSKLETPTIFKNHEVVVDLQEGKMQSSSMTARPPAATTTTVASKNAGKMEEMINSNYTCNSLERRKPETTDPSLHKGGDGCGRGISVPPGFNDNGFPGNNSRSGLSSSGSLSNGNGMHSETRQPTGLQNIPGMPYRSGTKDREIIVIHMVGGPGFYCNYPPQFGFQDSYNRNAGVFGSFPLQFGNFEPVYGLQGHGGPAMSAAIGSEFFHEHEDYICYEKDCYKGACHDIGRHRNSWVRGSFRENSFLGGVQGEAHDFSNPSTLSTIRTRSLAQRHPSRNAGRSRSLYRNQRVVSVEEATPEPVSEKRITLLTKVSQHDAHAKNSLKATEANKDAQIPAGPICSTSLIEEFCEDEGKAPLEVFEARKVTKEVDVEASLSADVSINLDTQDEGSFSKDHKVENNKDLCSKISCNDKCLHCKGAAVTGGSVTLVCQASEKTTPCERTCSTLQCRLETTEEGPAMTDQNDSSVDGCKADVKHVILDADDFSISSVKSEAMSKEQKTAMESNNCSLLPQSGNSEVLGMSTSLPSDTFLTKTAERHKKLIFKKKSQIKSAQKQGIRVSKAHFMNIKPSFQGTKFTSAVDSFSASKGNMEVTKTRQEDAVDSSPTTQLSHSEIPNLKTDASASLVAYVKKDAGRQKKLVYRKRVAEQAAVGPQPGRNRSDASESTKSVSALPQAELGFVEHEKDMLLACAPKYHVIQRRVYHVVEGSEENYYLPTAPLSCNLNGEKQLGNLKGKIVNAAAASSGLSVPKSLLLQESRSERKSCNSGRKDALHSAANSPQLSGSPLWSSRQEDNATKKHEYSGRPLSAWKPKVARQATTGREKSLKESDSPASNVPEEKAGALTSGTVGALTTTNEVTVGQKHELFSDSKSSSSGPTQCRVDNQLSKTDEFSIQDKLVEKLLDSVVSVGKSESGSSKHGQPPLGLPSPMTHIFVDVLAPKEIKQTPSQETMVANSKPFIKKNAMSFEQADRFHQILFRRYKEIGQWKPKANLHKKSIKNKENVRANQDRVKTLH